MCIPGKYQNTIEIKICSCIISMKARGVTAMGAINGAVKNIKKLGGVRKE